LPSGAWSISSGILAATSGSAEAVVATKLPPAVATQPVRSIVRKARRFDIVIAVSSLKLGL